VRAAPCAAGAGACCGPATALHARACTGCASVDARALIVLPVFACHLVTRTECHCCVAYLSRLRVPHGTTDTMVSSLCGDTEGRLRLVMNELAYNLESFNPAFTAVLLQARWAG